MCRIAREYATAGALSCASREQIQRYEDPITSASSLEHSAIHPWVVRPLQQDCNSLNLYLTSFCVVSTIGYRWLPTTACARLRSPSDLAVPHLIAYGPPVHSVSFTFLNTHFVLHAPCLRFHHTVAFMSDRPRSVP